MALSRIYCLQPTTSRGSVGRVKVNTEHGSLRAGACGLATVLTPLWIADKVLAAGSLTALTFARPSLTKVGGVDRVAPIVTKSVVAAISPKAVFAVVCVA